MKLATTLFVLSAFIAAQIPETGKVGVERPVGWWSDLMTNPRISLTQVMNEPESWRGRTVTLDATVKESVPHPGGLFTVLQSSHHVAFAVWPEEAPLWRKDVFDAPLKTVFVAKGSDAEKVLRRTARYGRLHVTARIVEVIGAHPWILVTAATPLEGAYDDASLASLFKAFALKEHRRYEAASEQFARSVRPTWPKSGQRLALLEEGRCLIDAGRESEGALKLVAALAIEDSSDVRAELARARTKDRPASRPVKPSPSPVAPSGKPANVLEATPEIPVEAGAQSRPSSRLSS